MNAFKTNVRVAFVGYVWSRIHAAFSQQMALSDARSRADFDQFRPHTKRVQGLLEIRTRTALGPYGRSMPRSIGPPQRQCVSLISSNPCTESTFLAVRPSGDAHADTLRRAPVAVFDVRQGLLSHQQLGDALPEGPRGSPGLTSF